MKIFLWEIGFEPYRLARFQWILFKTFGYKPKNPCGHTKHSRGYYCHLPMDQKHCIVINDQNRHEIVCKCCGGSCDVISESDLEKYKRLWKLFELEKQKIITDEQLDELDQLEKDGFYEIYLCCLDEDECDDVEITNEKELFDYMRNVEIVYKVVKSPDLTYEKL